MKIRLAIHNFFHAFERTLVLTARITQHGKLQRLANTHAFMEFRFTCGVFEASMRFDFALV